MINGGFSGAAMWSMLRTSRNHEEDIVRKRQPPNLELAEAEIQAAFTAETRPWTEAETAAALKAWVSDPLNRPRSEYMGAAQGKAAGEFMAKYAYVGPFFSQDRFIKPPNWKKLASAALMNYYGEVWLV